MQNGLQVRAGEILFREGDAPSGAFLIESGRVGLSATLSGERRVLGELGPGMLLGDMSAIDDSPRTVTAQALTDCRLTPLDLRRLAERLAATDPVVRALLTSQVARYHSMYSLLKGIDATAEAAPARDALAMDKIRLESELREALDNDGLEVRLQPVEQIISGRIAGYEALVRWHHPQRGEVAPVEFICLAEETSLIIPIGDHVLKRACEMLVQLRSRGVDPLPFIALNVSARQIEDPGLVDRILAKLREAELPPDRLRLEITESLVPNQSRVAALIRRCHDVGMRVALDDFGTGHANIDVLLALPFDLIKLDTRFSQALGSARGVAMVGAIVAMARAMGCELVAEGVETRDQRRVLHQLGCGYAQGWLIGRPMPFATVLAQR